MPERKHAAKRASKHRAKHTVKHRGTVHRARRRAKTATAARKSRRAPRAIWTGTVSFGLVSVPVMILAANREKRVTLHMVGPDGARVRRRYFSEHGQKPLDDDDIVHGYEVKKGKYVVLHDDELERLAPERTRNIGLTSFVKIDEIDPKYFDRAYYLAPATASTKAYRLLARVMEDAGRAGIATFVLRTREYLAAVIAEKGILRVETLHFADELRSAKDVGLPRPSRASASTVKRMVQQIEKHTKQRFDPDDLVDESAQKLVELAERKRREHEDVIDVPVDEQEQEDETGGADVIDLMSRLKQSIGATRHRRRAG